MPQRKRDDDMAIMITDECINCGACEPECPNNAIYEGGVEWAIADGNTVKGIYTLETGNGVDAPSPRAIFRFIRCPTSPASWSAHGRARLPIC